MRSLLMRCCGLPLLVWGALAFGQANAAKVGSAKEDPAFEKLQDDELKKLIEEDMKTEAKATNMLKDPEGVDMKNAGMSGLSKPFQFLYTQVALLETAIALQNTEINWLTDKFAAQSEQLAALLARTERLQSCCGEAGVEEAAIQAAQEARTAHLDELKKKEQRKRDSATAVLHKTLKKHIRRHHDGFEEFKDEVQAMEESQGNKSFDVDAGEALLSKSGGEISHHSPAQLQQRRVQRSKHNATETDLDAAVSSKVVKTITKAAKKVGNAAEDVGGAIGDGAKAIGGEVLSAADTVGNAFDEATDKVAFVAETVIDTVEKAASIITKGFADTGADCSFSLPKFAVDEEGFTFTLPRTYCHIRLVGQRITLFNVNEFSHQVDWFGPIKTIAKLGSQISDCTKHQSGAGNILVCVAMVFGETIIREMPPLSAIVKAQETAEQVLLMFAKIASVVVEQAIGRNLNLIQQAATGAFPEPGQEPKAQQLHKQLSLRAFRREIQSEFEDEASDSGSRSGKGKKGSKPNPIPPPDGLWSIGPVDGALQYQKLITQFSGFETDTGSCLAFAPSHRANGANSKVQQGDWQTTSDDKFIKLEPFAVPCANTWMKKNPDKWEGYTFYFSPGATEKCIAMTFGMGVQPVLAFVVGMEFGFMPEPIVELETTICWPDGQPDDQDLSHVSMAIKSAGIPLHTRTVRLIKRFGENTDFENGNIHETRAGPMPTFGMPTDGEDDSGLHSMNRISLMAHRKLMLASMDYDPVTGPRITQMFNGTEAEKILIQQKRKALEALQTSSEATSEANLTRDNGHQLFKVDIQNMGPVTFHIRGFLHNSKLNLGVRMGLGPWSPPEHIITLIDMKVKLALALAGLPFVSPDSKVKAVEALTNFDSNIEEEMRKQDKWKLALKTGKTSKFGFSSALWTDGSVFNADSPSMDEGDAKYSAFNTVPFQKMRMCVGRPTSNCVEHNFPKTYASARELFSSGYIPDSTLRKDDLLKAFGPEKDSYRDCPMQMPGFNIECRDGNRARWGWCANCPSQACQPGATQDADAAIGLGLNGQTTGEMGAGWTGFFAPGKNQCTASGKEVHKAVWFWVSEDVQEWKLALKTRSGSPKFGYTSSLWTNSNVFNSNSPATTAEDAKYSAFNTVPFRRVRMCVGSPDSNCVYHSFPWTYKSARELFSSGYVADSTVSKDDMLRAMGPEEGSYKDCPMQKPGFNVECKDGNKARWGWCANCPTQDCQPGDDDDADGVIGLGLQGQSLSHWISVSSTEMGAGYTALFAPGANQCGTTARIGAGAYKAVWFWVAEYAED